MASPSIGIAMSGGVDSTAAAILLKQHHTIGGFLMDLGQPGFAQQKELVHDIAGKLDIDLTVIDLKDAFKERVLDYFTQSYYCGKTPNPCLVCNREVKCGLFLEAVIKAGFDFMATGHYARIRREGNEHLLLKGLDGTKDQSYFLSRLTRSQLGKLIFPLGEMKKSATYELVERHGFSGFRGQESQDVCFLKNTSVQSFLTQHSPSPVTPGPIVTLDGETIGRHNGLFRYTIGQRRGLNLPDTSPWYVHSLDTGGNRLVVCRDHELLSHRLEATRINWLCDQQIRKGARFHAKLRSSHTGAEASITELSEDRITLCFTAAQRAVTPGQFVVLYDEDRVICSAEISTTACS